MTMPNPEDIEGPLDDAELNYQTVLPKDLQMAPTETPERAYAKLIGYVSYPHDEEYGVLYVVVRDNSTIVYYDVPTYMWEELKTASSTYQYLQSSGLWNYPYEYGQIGAPVSAGMLRYRRQKVLGKPTYAKTFGRGARGVTTGMRRVGTPRRSSSDPTKYTR